MADLVSKDDVVKAIDEEIAARLEGIDPDEASVYDLIKALKGE